MLGRPTAEWRTRSLTADGTLVCSPTAGDHAQPADISAQRFAQPAVRHCPKKALRGKRRCGWLGGASAERFSARDLPGDPIYRPAARTRRSAADVPSAHRRGQPAKGRPAAGERARPAAVATPSRANSSQRSPTTSATKPNQQPVRGRPLAEKPARRSACEVINGQNQRTYESFARSPAEFSRPRIPGPIAVS